jgi:hypothetical protein
MTVAGKDYTEFCPKTSRQFQPSRRPIHPEVVGAFFAPPTSKFRATRRARQKINTNYCKTISYNEYLNEK